MGRNTVTALRRLRRQQNAAAKQFRFGVADLKHAGNHAPPVDLARQIADTQKLRREQQVREVS